MPGVVLKERDGRLLLWRLQLWNSTAAHAAVYLVVLQVAALKR